MKTQSNYLKYIWIIPALYVSFEFAGKLFEALQDNQEFLDIISVIIPVHIVANFLSYFIGYFDFFIAITLLLIPLLQITKKYSKYIFLWVIFWPFIPASVRYFGGVADFEILQVLSMSFAALVSSALYFNFNKK